MKRSFIQPGGVLDSIRRLWWLILLITLLAAGAAAGLSLMRQTVIPSRGQIALSDVRNHDIETLGPVIRSNSRVADETLRILSDDVIETAAESLGVAPANLRRTVTARPAEEATAIVVDGRMSTAAASAERANALIAAYEVHVRQDRALRSAELIEALDRLISDEAVSMAELEARLAQIDTDLEGVARANAANEAQVPNALRSLQLGSAERQAVSTELTSSRSQIRTWERRRSLIAADENVFDGGIDFVRQARGASGPPEPNLPRNVGLAAALGLVIGLAMAWSLNGSAVERARQEKLEYERERERQAYQRAMAAPPGPSPAPTRLSR